MPCVLITKLFVSFKSERAARMLKCPLRLSFERASFHNVIVYYRKVTCVKSIWNVYE